MTGRTVDDWRASEIGRIAMAANLRTKIAYAQARREGVDLSPGSFADGCREMALKTYVKAHAAWLGGDIAAAVEHAANIGFFAGMLVAAGAVRKEEQHSVLAAKKGKRGAAARWAGRDVLTAIIQELACRHDSWGEPLRPSELWPHFFAELDDLGLHPVERDPDPLKDASIEFRGGNIKYLAFKEQMRQKRKMAGP